MLTQKRFKNVMQRFGWQPIVKQQYWRISWNRGRQYRVVVGFKDHPGECNCSYANAQKILEQWKEINNG